MSHGFPCSRAAATASSTRSSASSTRPVACRPSTSPGSPYGARRTWERGNLSGELYVTVEMPRVHLRQRLDEVRPARVEGFVLRVRLEECRGLRVGDRLLGLAGETAVSARGVHAREAAHIGRGRGVDDVLDPTDGLEELDGDADHCRVGGDVGRGRDVASGAPSKRGAEVGELGFHPVDRVVEPRSVPTVPTVHDLAPRNSGRGDRVRRRAHRARRARSRRTAGSSRAARTAPFPWHDSRSRVTCARVSPSGPARRADRRSP